MMSNFKMLLFGLLAFSAFTFTSCDDDPVSIVETAQDTDNLSTLVAALTQAGLVSTLEGDGPFTVFAPTNDAFQGLLDSNPDWNTLADIDNATLTNVLTFHVVAADVKAADLTDSYVTTLATAAGEQIVLQIDVTGGTQFNGSASPVTTDIEASNGTIHIIDEVMLPPSVVDLAVNNPNLSTLVAALTRSDLPTDYVATLSGDGPFTVFAPTNAAFGALLDSNADWSSLDDIPVETLVAVLNYHVVSGANVQSDQLSNGQSVSTLGGDFTIDLSSGVNITTTGGQTVGVALADIQGANGVVHVVDAVLLP